MACFLAIPPRCRRVACLVKDERLVATGLLKEGPRAHNGVPKAAQPQRSLPAPLVRQRSRARITRLIVGHTRARAAHQDEVRLLPAGQRLLIQNHPELHAFAQLLQRGWPTFPVQASIWACPGLLSVHYSCSAGSATLLHQRQPPCRCWFQCKTCKCQQIAVAASSSK